MAKAINRLSALHKLTISIGGADSISVLIPAATASIAETILPDAILFYLLQSDELRLAHTWQRSPGMKAVLHEEKKIGVCFCGIAAQGKPVYSKNIVKDPNCTLAECKDAGLHSFAALPLRWKDEVLGVLAMGSIKERDFRKEHEYLEILAAHIAIALRTAIARDELQRHTDMLNERVKDLEDTKRALSESKAHFQLLFERTPVPYQSLDAYGQLIEVNQAWLDTLGYSREEVLGRWMGDFMTPELRALFVDGLPCFKKADVIRGHELDLVRKDGTVVVVSVDGRIERNIRGEFEKTYCVLNDITEWKKAKASILASEEKYRTLFESASDAIFIIDAEGPDAGRIYAANGAAASMHGYTIDELLRMRIRDLDSPKSAKESDEKIRQLLSGKHLVFELEHVRKDGTIFPVEVNAGLMNIQGHRYVLGFDRDISDRMIAEESLRKSEERFKLAMEANRDGLWDWNVQTDEVYYSPGYTAMLGYTSSDAPARITSWMDLMHPDDREAALKANMECIENLRDDFEVEFRMKCKNGDWCWILGRGKAVGRDKGGRAIRLIGTHTDITDRKKAEDALRESERKYRELVENANSIILRWNPDGEITFLNEFGQKFFGYREDEILGRNVLGTIVPDRESTGRNLRPLMESICKNPASFDQNMNENMLRDGSRVWIAWTNKTVFDAEGNIVEVLSIGTDITERKRMEEVLRTSEEQVRLALKAVNQGLYDLNIATGEARVSPEYATMLGYDPAEFRETNEAWIERLHPEDRSSVTSVYQKYISGETPEYRVEFRQRTQSGDWKWILSLGKIVEWNTEGAPLHMIGTHTDITELKNAEQAIAREKRLSDHIINSLPGIFYMFDAQGKLVRWNDKFREVAGYSPDELFSTSYTDFFSKAHNEYISSRVQSVFTEGEAFAEAPFMTKSGEQIPYFFTGRLIVSAGRQYLIGVGVDMTDSKRAEEERNSLQAQLLQAQKMESVGRLAGGVAHDFNNMLGVILGHVELAMIKLNPGDPINENLEEIEAAAHRSADLTRQLLAFARRQTVAPEVLDLNDCVAKMLKMLQRLIGEDIDLIWMPGANIWTVKIDPAQVDQLLANLCVNARDAINGVGRVTIETKNITFDEAYCAVNAGFDCGDYVMLAVNDNGCGLSKDAIDHIFEPFFTTKEIGKGTGLGLATVFGIVKQNGGFINVYSEPGQGTTFKLYLPRFLGQAIEPKAAKATELPRGRHETLLLVEDELAILNVGKAMLEELGYKVLTASAPGEALSLFKVHAAEIQLLITDVIMPEMTGRDLANFMTEIKPNLKCLFTSGYTANVIAHHGVLDDDVKFLQKPFSMNDIAYKVCETLKDK